MITVFHIVISAAVVIISVASYVNQDCFQCFRLWPDLKILDDLAEWPWRNSLMLLWLFPFACVAALSCLSQGCGGVCRSLAQRLPRAAVCDCTSVLRSPSRQGAPSSPHSEIPKRHFLSFREGQLPLLPALVELQGMLSAVLQAGNVELSFPNCMGVCGVFLWCAPKFIQHLQLHRPLHLPVCQQSTGFNLESCLCSKSNVHLSSYKFATQNSRAHGWSLAQRRVWQPVWGWKFCW